MTMKFKGDKDIMAVINLIYKNKNTYVKEAPNFRRIFGVELSRFWNGFGGFDVIAFDSWLDTPMDVSVATLVRERYGVEGFNVILRMLK